MKNKRINLLLILCFSLIFFITSFDCAYAAEENGSLNIILTYERQAIDGAEFSVYQVAKWNEKESRHTVKAPFRWNGDFVNIKTADDQLKLSLYFEKQSRNIKEMMKGETGDDGTAKFTDLKDGIYLHLIDKKQMDQHNLILVTAITPTKAGIGKTTVSIGLALGLNKIGKKAVVALREPSLGPCFGMKGGAAG